MFNIRPSSYKMSKSEKDRLIKIGINKLKWYKDRNWNKKTLLDSKIFPKSFIEKYFDAIKL